MSRGHPPKVIFWVATGTGNENIIPLAGNGERYLSEENGCALTRRAAVQITRQITGNPRRRSNTF